MGRGEAFKVEELSFSGLMRRRGAVPAAPLTQQHV